MDENGRREIQTNPNPNPNYGQIQVVSHFLVISGEEVGGKLNEFKPWNILGNTIDLT